MAQIIIQIHSQEELNTEKTTTTLQYLIDKGIAWNDIKVVKQGFRSDSSNHYTIFWIESHVLEGE